MYIHVYSHYIIECVVDEPAKTKVRILANSVSATYGGCECIKVCTNSTSMTERGNGPTNMEREVAGVAYSYTCPL